ncbi:hypothetical protein BDV33DRAFT_186384, partial [Aspergillus novoparasiticus]
RRALINCVCVYGPFTMNHAITSVPLCLCGLILCYILYVRSLSRLRWFGWTHC